MLERHRGGEEYIAEVVDFGMNGEGIIKLDNYPVFVNNAIKGEKIKVRLTYTKKDYAFGELLEIIEPSPDRVKPICPYYTKCGGCDMQHISYERQLEIKRLHIERTLKKNAGLEIEVPTPISKNQWKYRNKLALPFGNRGDRVVLGLYEKQTHKVVPMKFCPLHDDWASNVIRIITEWANENNISIYDELALEGFLRHLVVRKLDRLEIVIVGNGDELLNRAELILKLKQELGDYALYFSPNKERGNVILGNTVEFISGNQSAQDIAGLKVKLSPLSFLQVNLDVMKELYDDVARHLDGYKGDVVELFSGVGILTASLAKRMPRTFFKAVEIVPEAVQDAKQIMHGAGLENRVECICEDAGKYMEELAISQKKNVLVLDPPRKGIDERVVEKALLARFDKIVYISCNPATLGRDLKALQDIYKVEYIQPYDMFPQTMHVETLVILSIK